MGVLDCRNAVMYVPEAATNGSFVGVKAEVPRAGLLGDRTAIVSGSEEPSSDRSQI
jgi:hypothetical protein